MIGLIREHRATTFVGIPSMYAAMLTSKKGGAEDLRTLKYAVSGGEPLPEDICRRFHERFGLRINEGYGLTETAPCTNWCRPEEWKLHSVGKTLTGIETRIVDLETGDDQPANEEGEVRFRGPNVMQGYYNLPEETAEAFDDRGFFRTGDIGKLDEEGHLYITGRLKEMLIVGGENVFPREIEEVLNRHPSIHASAVLGQMDDVRGEVPIAFVELEEGAPFDETELKQWCQKSLAGYKVPRDIRVLDELPRNPTGKIMRRELKPLLLRASA
jgi:long-chain acyl-CoA synthetase